VAITSGNLAQWTTGKRHPSLRMRRRLQRALDIDRFDDLFIVERGDAI